MAMIKCIECGKEISSNAKVCPNCGKQLKPSGGKIVALVILLIISLWFLISGLLNMVGYSVKNNTNNNINSETQTSVTSKKQIVAKENYEKIKEGMTKQQVKEILGEPMSVSESETPGIGKMELNHYQEPFSLKAIDIYYLDGKVYMKNWSQL